MYFQKIVQKLLMGALTCLIASNVWADCAGGAMWFWPESKQIIPNQVMIVNCYGNMLGIARQMGGKYKPYLVSGNERVPLAVVEICEGEFFQTQSILHPVKPLTAGKQYSLQIDGLPKAQDWEDTFHEAFQGPFPSWLVAGETDVSDPAWLSEPKVAGKEYVAFGCGPGVSVNFEVKSSESDNALVRVEVRRMGSDSWTAWYLPVVAGKVDVGHGMCSGAFAFEEPGKYEAKFTLADAAGNWVAWAGDPIRFEPPTASTED